MTDDICEHNGHKFMCFTCLKTELDETKDALNRALILLKEIGIDLSYQIDDIENFVNLVKNGKLLK